MRIWTTIGTVFKMPYPTDSDMMCDWFAASQVHAAGVPVKCEGIITCSDNDGSLEWQNVRAYQHSGSFDTSIRIKSDGNRVSLSGNVGRFGRADNVFGYSLDECKQIANGILESLGLPHFTNGDKHIVPVKKANGEFISAIGYTGAKVSQLHMTSNYLSGSERDAHGFLYWLTSQKVSNTETTHYGRKTVYFGERSKYQRTKVYDKAEAIKNELNKINRKAIECDDDLLRLQYVRDLCEWARSFGLVRFETEFKSRYLTQNFINDWATCNDACLWPHFETKRGAIMKRCENYANLEDLSPRAQDLYHAYMAGVNLRDRHNWSSATFYRYKAQLLTVGIDISRPLDAEAHKVRPRIIELTPAIPPEFYQLPSVAELKEAA